MFNNLKVEATQFFIHQNYSADTGINDIALIEINPLKLNSTIFPACLWYNTTHLPFRLKKVVFDRQGKSLIKSQNKKSLLPQLYFQLDPK
jgi:Trypsin